MEAEPHQVIQFYCGRGKMENFIKEGKSGFDFSSVSSHSRVVNAVGVFLLKEDKNGFPNPDAALPLTFQSKKIRGFKPLYEKNCGCLHLQQTTAGKASPPIYYFSVHYFIILTGIDATSPAC